MFYVFLVIMGDLQSNHPFVDSTIWQAKIFSYYNIIKSLKNYFFCND